MNNNASVSDLFHVYHIKIFKWLMALSVIALYFVTQKWLLFGSVLNCWDGIALRGLLTFNI